MPGRLNAPLDDWAAADVLALIEEQIEEGQRLEYKRQLDLSTPKQRREAAKDSSGLANAQGGLLIYGVDEEEQPDGRRIPVRPTPLTAGDVRSRLEDVLDSSVTPTLNLEIRQLETEGGYFLVVRAFPRLGIPHMVDAYDEKRCYIRVGLKTRPMEQHELTAAYADAAVQEHRAMGRLTGLPLIARPENISLERPEERQRPGPWITVLTLFRLAPSGRAGFVMANGSLTTMTGGEGKIREGLVRADVVDCIVALPAQLFYTTGIPVCLWFFDRDKAYPPRGGAPRDE